MTFVVTDHCQGCRFTECVAVCPVECFHADARMVYIDGNVCIDCGACEPACPVHAIYDELTLPPDKESWKATNKSKVEELPVISAKETPLPTAEARRRELGFV